MKKPICKILRTNKNNNFKFTIKFHMTLDRCRIPIRHFFSQSRRLLTKIFRSAETVNVKFNLYASQYSKHLTCLMQSICRIPIRHFFSQSRRLLTKIFLKCRNCKGEIQMFMNSGTRGNKIGAMRSLSVSPFHPLS